MWKLRACLEVLFYALTVRKVHQSATLTVDHIVYCSRSRRFDIAGSVCDACDRVERTRWEVGAFTERWVLDIEMGGFTERWVLDIEMGVFTERGVPLRREGCLYREMGVFTERGVPLQRDGCLYRERGAFTEEGVPLQRDGCLYRER